MNQIKSEIEMEWLKKLWIILQRNHCDTIESIFRKRKMIENYSFAMWIIRIRREVIRPDGKSTRTCRWFSSIALRQQTVKYIWIGWAWIWDLFLVRYWFCMFSKLESGLKPYNFVADTEAIFPSIPSVNAFLFVKFIKISCTLKRI